MHHHVGFLFSFHILGIRAFANNLISYWSDIFTADKFVVCTCGCVETQDS